MERVILVRYTEIHLKGLNRPYFEQKLVDNMRSALRGIPSRIDREHGRIYVMDIPDVQFDEAISRLTRVFGIHSVSPALAVDKDWQSVCSTAYMLMDKEIEKSEFQLQGFCPPFGQALFYEFGRNQPRTRASDSRTLPIRAC